MKSNQKGFSIVEVLIIVAVIGIVAALSWVAYSKFSAQPTDTDTPSGQNTSSSTDKASDANEGYFVVKEWGLRFTVPSELTEVQYRINGDTVALYAKPSGYTVSYRADFEALSNAGQPLYALGQLYRSTQSTQDVMGEPREGKKLGDYYYYTAHAFSSLATGAAITGLYFDAACSQDSRQTSCEEYTEAETKAFLAINQGSTGLPNTVELAK